MKRGPRLQLWRKNKSEYLTVEPGEYRNKRYVAIVVMYWNKAKDAYQHSRANIHLHSRDDVTRVIAELERYRETLPDEAEQEAA